MTKKKGPSKKKSSKPEGQTKPETSTVVQMKSRRIAAWKF